MESANGTVVYISSEFYSNPYLKSNNIYNPSHEHTSIDLAPPPHFPAHLKYFINHISPKSHPTAPKNQSPILMQRNNTPASKQNPNQKHKNVHHTNHKTHFWTFTENGGERGIHTKQ